MPEETGWSEPFRVRFPNTTESILRKLADLDNRSVPSLIQFLTIEALAKRYADKQMPIIKESIMRGEWIEEL